MWILWFWGKVRNNVEETCTHYEKVWRGSSHINIIVWMVSAWIRYFCPILEICFVNGYSFTSYWPINGQLDEIKEIYLFSVWPGLTPGRPTVSKWPCNAALLPTACLPAPEPPSTFPQFPFFLMVFPFLWRWRCSFCLHKGRPRKGQ